MISIDDKYEGTYVINKSKFLSFAYPVFNENDCNKYLKELECKYSDATHICFAYVLDSPSVEKCSDNGEPVGTAGKPILELIKKRKLNNIMVVVIRYFGGIKLGAGGLVRAYTNSGNLALKDARVIELKDVCKYRVSVTYDDVDRIKSIILSNKGSIKNIFYSEIVEMEFLLEDVTLLKEYNVQIIGSERICL